MKERIYIDIETIPTDNVTIRKHIADNLKPPGNIKKPETIKAWLDDPDNLNNALDKTSLNGAFGQIACIGVARDTGPVTILSGAEPVILNELAEFVYDAQGALQPLVGHNVLGFDLPFINQRMMVNGYRQLIPAGARPWDLNAHDTMTIFASTTRDYISLVDLCLALGVEKPLDEIDGSQVAETWRAGNHQAVYDHCASDVIATRACYQKMARISVDEAEAA